MAPLDPIIGLNEEFAKDEIICIDDEYVYEYYCQDFGPFDLGKVYRFCEKFYELLESHKDKVITHLCAEEPQKRSNAAFLMLAFQIVVLKRSAEDAWAGFAV